MRILGTRTGRLRVAAIVSILVATSSIVLYDLPALADGAAGRSDPFALVLGSFTTDVIALITVYGVLRRQRWGVITLIVVNAFWALQAGDALVDANAALGATMLLVSLFCIWCCLARDDVPAAASFEQQAADGRSSTTG